MSDCEYCDVKRQDLLYSDDKINIFLSKNAAVPGHVIVAPKQHFTIFEQVPDSIVKNLFDIANKFSTLLFDALGAKGTNVLVENGNAAGQKMPHFSVNVLPRFPGDGINLQWQPRQLSEEQMSTIEVQLRSDLENAVPVQEELETKVLEEKKEEIIEQAEDEEDYFQKQLRRTP